MGLVSRMRMRVKLDAQTMLLIEEYNTLIASSPLFLGILRGSHCVALASHKLKVLLWLASAGITGVHLCIRPHEKEVCRDGNRAITLGMFQVCKTRS